MPTSGGSGWLNLRQRRPDSLTQTGTVQAGSGPGIRAALYRISRYDRQLNAFATVLAEEALVTAHQLDQLAPQDRGPLHGVPVAIKEEMHVAGVVTTFGTRANTIPAAQDSQVVSRLRDAGAVIIGTTRMPEFGAWPFTDTTGYGVTRNPHDQTRTPGGSSGGSAAAVAAGLVPLAIGGDGGGSIRIPAALRLFGQAPTWRVSHSTPSVACAGNLRPADQECAGFRPGLRRHRRKQRHRRLHRGPHRVAGGRGCRSVRPSTTARRGGAEGTCEDGPVAPGARGGSRARCRSTQSPRAHLGRSTVLVVPESGARVHPQFFAGTVPRSAGGAPEWSADTHGRVDGCLGTRAVRRVAGAKSIARAMGGTLSRDVLLTPTVRGSGSDASPDGGGALALAASGPVAYTAMWNVTGFPGRRPLAVRTACRCRWAGGPDNPGDPGRTRLS